MYKFGAVTHASLTYPLIRDLVHEKQVRKWLFLEPLKIKPNGSLLRFRDLLHADRKRDRCSEVNRTLFQLSLRKSKEKIRLKVRLLFIVLHCHSCRSNETRIGYCTRLRLDGLENGDHSLFRETFFGNTILEGNILFSRRIFILVHRRWMTIFVFRTNLQK